MSMYIHMCVYTRMKSVHSRLCSLLKMHGIIGMYIYAYICIYMYIIVRKITFYISYIYADKYMQLVYVCVCVCVCVYLSLSLSLSLSIRL